MKIIYAFYLLCFQFWILFNILLTSCFLCRLLSFTMPWSLFKFEMWNHPLWFVYSLGSANNIMLQYGQYEKKNHSNMILVMWDKSELWFLNWPVFIKYIKTFILYRMMGEGIYCPFTGHTKYFLYIMVSVKKMF